MAIIIASNESVLPGANDKLKPNPMLRHESLSLYHRDICLPAALSDVLGRYLVTRWTKYASGRLEDWGLPRLGYITLHEKRIVEVGLHPETGAIESIVYREGWNTEKDVILSVRPYFSEGFALVKTVWSNKPGDNHFSVRRYRYVQPPRAKGVASPQPVNTSWLNKQPAGAFNAFPELPALAVA